MQLDADPRSRIALNVTRTRITVLAFNLTIITLMLSGRFGDLAATPQGAIEHFPTSIALFIGFCMTFVGLIWFLLSQELDVDGLSKPMPFVLGSISAYLALSQTVTAFMHEYILRIITTMAAVYVEMATSDAFATPAEMPGTRGLIVLSIFGGTIWAWMMYVGPLLVSLRVSRDHVSLRLLLGYYVFMQLLIAWIHARAWQVSAIGDGEQPGLFGLYLLQFIQPVLWFR